jgi:hypothetical protein
MQADCCGFSRPAYPLPACNTAYVVFTAFFPIGTSASALLWLFRLRAIYGNDRTVTFIFGFLWLTVVGGSLTIPIGGAITTSLVNPTGCLVVRAKKYDSAAGIVLTVYDTLVFLAISYRLVSNFTKTQHQTPWEQIKALFSGSDLPAFSKTLLTDGQIFYMCVSNLLLHIAASIPFLLLSARITVMVNIVASLIVHFPVGPVYHALLTIPSVTLTSILTCRVYRRTRLGVVRGHRELTLPTLNPLGPRGNLAIPLSVLQFSSESSGEARSGDGSNSATDKSVTLGTPSKTNTLNFLTGTSHDTGTGSAPDIA